jgi:hypothetical protein
MTFSEKLGVVVDYSQSPSSTGPHHIVAVVQHVFMKAPGAVQVHLPEISVDLPCPCGRERLGTAQPSAPCDASGRDPNSTVLHSMRKAFLESNFALCPRRAGVQGG